MMKVETTESHRRRMGRGKGTISHLKCRLPSLIFFGSISAFLQYKMLCTRNIVGYNITLPPLPINIHFFNPILKRLFYL